MEKSIKYLKLSLIIILQILFITVCLEKASHYFLTHSKNALYRARVVLQANAEFGWLLRPGLATSFEGAELFTTNESLRAEYRFAQASEHSQLLVLGPSSAFGWGVEYQQTYGYLAAKELKLNVINAAQIGHSVWQGQRLWKKRYADLNPRPQYAMLAYGINDLDRFRFYGTDPGSDRDFFNKNPLALSRLNYAEKHSHFLTLFSLSIDELRSYYNCQHLQSAALRSSPHVYISIMQELVTDLKQRGIIPIIINTPFYLKEKDNSYSREKINDLYAEVSQLAQSRKCRQARAKLQEAKSLEPERIREDVLELNQQLLVWAESQSLVYIDAHSLLKQKEHFVDPVHPSESGHKIVAEAVVSAIINSGIKYESK